MKLKKIAACAAAVSVAATMAVAANAAAPYTATIGFADGQWYAQDWETSIEIPGDGTYSISTNIPAGVDEETGDPIPVTATGASVFVIDIPELGTDAGISTEEDYDMSKIKISDLSVDLDGSPLTVDASKLLWGDPEDKGNLRIEIFNLYGATAVDEKYDASVSPINPDDIADVAKITVTFTITGIDGGGSAAEPESSAPDATEAPATDATEAPATDAPTTGDSTKPSTNTGAEGIAIAAGVAIVAVGAAIIAKKRK